MAWIAPPEPMTWLLPAPIQFGSAAYPTVTLRAPTAGDVLKATAIPGASGMQVTLQLIAKVSVEQIPYEALPALPAYLVEQMGSYMDLFGGAPLPSPLEDWRAACVASAKADAEARALAVIPAI